MPTRTRLTYDMIRAQITISSMFYDMTKLYLYINTAREANISATYHQYHQQPPVKGEPTQKPKISTLGSHTAPPKLMLHIDDAQNII